MSCAPGSASTRRRLRGRGHLRGGRDLARVAADLARRALGRGSTGPTSTAGGALDHAGRDLQRGAGPRGLAADPRAGGRDPRRPDVDGARHRGTAGAVDAADPRRRRRVVPAVQRARRGSDLASLSTRARKTGGVYRVSGQKVWSSYATFADMGIALVRTDPDAPPHKGISMLAIPMNAPGVDVRPLRQMTGDHEFNEVFLDEVEVPVENLIGPGERGLAGREHDARQRARRVVHLEGAGAPRGRDRAARRGVRASWRPRDPLVRQRLARSWIDVEIFRLHNARTLSRLARGEEIGSESSIVKLFWAGMSQRFSETATAVLGPRSAPAMAGDADAQDRGRSAPPAVGTRQLDHGWHERDPAQHHRRAHPRPAPGAEMSDTARTTELRRSARPRRSAALRARRVSPRRVDAVARRGAGGAHRGTRVQAVLGDHEARRHHGDRPPTDALLERVRNHARACEQPVMKMPEMVVMLDPPRHVPMRRVVSGRFTPKSVRARRTTSTA